MTSRFGARSEDFFRSVYDGGAPWDIGAPQPDMLALLQSFPPRAPVLDLGCGSGDVALHVASMGHRTIGVDFVAKAITQAEGKRASVPAYVAERLTFHVADALRPSALGATFGAVLDSGFLHLFGASETLALVEEVARVLEPGGRYYLHEFAVEFPVPNTPRAVSEEELRSIFSAARGWRLLEIRAGRFFNTVADPVPAIVACVERAR
jgi:ubiquinone/menaquinone biosynthesis C-methylase UbiE